MSEQKPERREFSLKRLLPLALLLAATAAFFAFGGGRYLNFSVLSRERAALADLTARLGLLAPVVFVLAYAAVAALSVPGAAVLTITSGFLFGTVFGALYSVFGATAGATLLFLAARAGLGGLLARAGSAAQNFEAGFRQHAFNYLLVLRLIPIFPFWLVNLAAALVRMRLSSFVLGTFLGIIPGSLVYASLGNGLEKLVAAGKAPGFDVLLRANILLPLIGLALLALAAPLYRWWQERSARP